ncbi:MAG: adenylate/guanylate cyclase domain-containing response regulator [Chloroflexi bacterium 13_1_40CM_4_68_4]|nr:MAG: adenylate/guanylate cyclase domain-containing response regulator [Chloroflexi bacterium 13_1_40CM_4_68_4]
MSDEGRILVVDDQRQNLRLLEAVLAPRGYTVLTASSGDEALERIAADSPDLILLDIVMPGMNGYEVIRRIRADARTSFLPVVMVTASPEQDKIEAIEAGADDFIPKPFEQHELLARVRSLLRIKRYHDTIARQSAELAEWNRTLEERVGEQVNEIVNLRRLRRFLSPQIADLVLSQGGEASLEPHRRDISVVNCDLRGFTAFSETGEPEDVMRVMREYHEALGEIVFRFEGTVRDMAGDGIMVLFNDPIPFPDATARAVRMAVTMRDRMAELGGGWRKLGHELGFGVGISRGYATLGRIGFEGRFEYGAVGTVVNLAARLCGEAKSGQILLSQRAYAAVEDFVEAQAVGELTLKGLARPVATFNVLRLREPSPA